MDAREKASAACEQDTIMTNAWWSSTPLLSDDTVPIMSNGENLVFWDNSLRFDPSSFDDVLRLDSLQPSPLENMEMPTSQYEATLHGLDIDINSALEWVDFDTPLESSNTILDLHPVTITVDDPSPVSLDLRSTDDPTDKIRRTTINRHQKEILTNWIAVNPEPYPSKEEKEMLATATGLSIKQISGWFTRTRQRVLQRVQSNALVATPDGIPRLTTTLERRTTGEVVVLSGNQQSSRLTDSSGRNPHTTLNPYWPRCASLPPEPNRRFSRKPSKRARSLPYMFTLDNIRPRISSLSQVSQGQLSMDVAAATHESGVFERNKPNADTQLPPQREVEDPLYPLKPIPNSSFVEAWIEDVARHGVSTPENPKKTACYSSSVESHDINDNHPLEETRGRSRLSGLGELITNSKMSTTDDQNSRRPVKASTRVRGANACQYCKGRKVRCSGLADSPSGKCINCIKMNQECIFYTQDENRFDAKSTARSSISSASSASSYMSFGPRKGRRVAFRNPFYYDPDNSPPAAARIDEAPISTERRSVSSLKRKAQSPPDDEGNRSRSFIPGGYWSRNETRRLQSSQSYACTFCHEKFAYYYTWRRHEESIHFSQHTWTLPSVHVFMLEDGIYRSNAMST
ncbi:hypothetical protein F5Y09DRAFT_345343 [Xylaria sp. FL1042]|nr:hypothetical protein F5Y09DRAFT_345343 [Xylaria sp. FL1042]